MRRTRNNPADRGTGASLHLVAESAWLRTVRGIGPSASSAGLLNAALLGDRPFVAALLARGVSPDTQDEQGRTALLEAAFGGHAEMVALLLAHGADVNLADHEDWTPLMEAAAKGWTDIVALLLAAGAAVDRQPKCGWTLLQLAATGQPPLLHLLKSAGAQ